MIICFLHKIFLVSQLPLQTAYSSSRRHKPSLIMLSEHRITSSLLFPACYRNTLFTIQMNFNRMKWLWRTQRRCCGTLCTKKGKSSHSLKKQKEFVKSTLQFYIKRRIRFQVSAFTAHWCWWTNFQDKTPAHTSYTTTLKSSLLGCIFLNITFSYCFSFGNTWQRLSFKENNRWMPCLYLINIIWNTCKCRRHSGTGCAIQIHQMKIKYPVSLITLPHYSQHQEFSCTTGRI